LPMNGAGYPVFGMADGEHVIVQDSAGALQIIDATEGRVVKAIVALERDSIRTPNITNFDDKWYIASPWHAVALDRMGRLLWRDAITSIEKALLSQVITDRHIVLLANSPQPLAVPQPPNVLHGLQVIQGPLPDQIAEPIEMPRRINENYHYRLFILDRKTGCLLDERVVGPLRERLLGRSTQAMNDRILLTTSSHTIVIPTSNTNSD